MRLDKITIGSSSKSPSHQFKNLKDITIDFDQNHWVTVVIGWNGTGKSNVLEALAIIFREFISPKKNPKIDFAFNLSYWIGTDKDERAVVIDHDPDRIRNKFLIHIAEKSLMNNASISEYFTDDIKRDHIITINKFLDDTKALPRYVFSYYSGDSQRMHEIFLPYLEWYDDKLRKGEDPGNKRLFYALPVHSQFVLLAFLIERESDDDLIADFLRDNLGLDPIDGLESVLFVLRQPPWKPRDDGDLRFWGAKGVVSKFLSKLLDISLAPIETTRRVPVSLWNKETLQFKYLFVKDIASLRKLVGDQSPAAFFRDLESTYVSQLINEVRIKVKLKKSDQTVTFRELSEGEQQLLTVLGLLKFTADEESLFLLDEPDTHLNPRWSVDYLNYLKNVITRSSKGNTNSHILLTTHNPLAIAELVKEQVQILHIDDVEQNRKVIATYPEDDPRGMGYAAIVASDMFGIASTLDQSTQQTLEKQRILGAKKNLTLSEQQELDQLNDQLNKLGFRFFHPDDEYSRYLRIRHRALTKRFKTEETEALSKSTVSLNRQEREQLAKELIDDLLADNDNQQI
ncbi:MULTISPECIES: AAA family ATPase [Mucilaginibacter]|uniref:AAA family ATPase n=2 Tax=Mucilaginibacter TaxID=423349 RepID=A0A6I4I898_9SPHI|nr:MULTISPECIES: AAA family ATPase [Mucilaginibacter]MDT3401081.1 putative ATPase [Mucilaginibacter terrae]MVN91430.1 AAA family ATPase [Mucilaginibacter aquatilis]